MVDRIAPDMTTTYAPLATAVFPRRWQITATLVVSFTLLTAVAAQFRIYLDFTPVPITGQTLAVLLSGGVLGSRAGAASQALYWMGGLVLPWFAGANGGLATGEWEGWEVVTGATGGYLIGFILAAYAVGYLSERGQDRNVATAIPAFLAGTLIIYLFGVPWLAHIADLGWVEAVELGAVPFVLVDLIKVAAAGLLLPGGWHFTKRWRENT